MTRRIAFGIVLAALVAVAPGIARAACGGVGKRVLTRDPGSVSFEHGRTDERLLPYYWAATHQPGSGDCGVHARSTLPGVSVFQTYGEMHPAAEAFSPNSIPVGGAIGDAPPGAAIGPEIPGTLRIKVYDWAPPGSGRIDLFHNTACDVCPRKLEFMGSLRVYVNPQLQLSGSLYDPQQVLSVQAQDRTRLDVADGVFPVPAGGLRLGLALPFGPGLRVGEIESGGSADWYHFGAVAGTSYEIETSLGSLRDTTLSLYESNASTRLHFNDDALGSYASRIVWTAPRSGVFYVKAAAYAGHQIGRYAVRIRATGSSSPLAYVEQGFVKGSGSWHAFRASKGATYRLETQLESLADSTLTLLRPDAASVERFDDDGGSQRYASRIVWTAPADGVYYVRVAGYRSGQTGSYTLALTALPPLPRGFGW
jgi:hypothetical protein